MVAFFGASPDTGNLGVSALCLSVVQGLIARRADARLRVFDHGRGLRSGTLGPAGAQVRIERCGASHTRRLHRPEALLSMYAAARFGFPPRTNVGLIREAAAVVDISGGDSFTDLYGPHRFQAVTLSKRIALELGRPLILLPQTYGPFESAKAREMASSICRRAAMAWARDARSFEALRSLLGDEFDPARHRLGMDVAFGMGPAEPPAEVRAALPIEAWRKDGRTIVGFNVSGLIWNDPHAATSRYGFRADYRAAVVGVLTRLLGDPSVAVLIVPHVLAPRGHYESDDEASRAALESLSPGLRDRVHIASGYESAPEAKWLIGRCDWFCGTRMHATIAGLSSGVPTAAIAYSQKTIGVFESCSVGEAVVDPRELGTEAVVERVWAAWEAREAHRRALADAREGIRARTADQMDRIAGACGLIGASRGTG